MVVQNRDETFTMRFDSKKRTRLIAWWYTHDETAPVVVRNRDVTESAMVQNREATD